VTGATEWNLDKKEDVWSEAQEEKGGATGATASVPNCTSTRTPARTSSLMSDLLANYPLGACLQISSRYFGPQIKSEREAYSRFGCMTGHKLVRL
ncbi:11624_t:CDS:2, partial [Acaulospora colombiana]